MAEYQENSKRSHHPDSRGGGPIGSGTPDACYMLCLFVVHLPFEAWLSIKRIQKGRIILIAEVAVP